MIDLSKLPNNPGCYLFKDKSGKIIYVGKAKNLSKRVKSYFARDHERVWTNVLVGNIRDVDFVVTDNEYEALLLENNLIKKHKPRYNIDLKDSRRYAYIMITGEEFPRLKVARDRKEKGEYFGPFVSGLSRDYVLASLQKIFGIRTCNKLPKRACIRYSLGLCSAPCIKAVTKEEYLRDVESVRKVLKGQTRNIVEMLDKDMKRYSRENNFERAMRTRNQIYAIRDLGERQNVERQKKFDEDIINWVVHSGRVNLMLFNSKKGMLDNKQDFEFSETDEFLDEFLVRYYSDNVVPREIVLPVKPNKEVVKFLSSQGKTRVVVPSRGEKKQLLDLVLKNIEIGLFGDMNKLGELRDKLKLGELPRVIECFDVSHLSGTSTVAAMVQFRNGKPQKSEYRRYKIRGDRKKTGEISTRIHADSRGSFKGGDFVQNDDYASMREVVERRYSKLKREGLAMPNLIIVDGGKGQLSAVLEVMEEIGVKVPVVAIAKREEEIFLPAGKKMGVGGVGVWEFRKIVLDRKGGALKLVQSIRDEAHRFAISYNRLLRKKKIRE